QTEAGELLAKIRHIEGEDGVLWRYGQAVTLIHRARRGDTKGLALAQTLVSEILAHRGTFGWGWWGGPLLQGELAELKGELDAAIRSYLRAVELGSSQPGLARRLIGLLNQRQEFDQIDHVLQILQNRGVVPEDLTSLIALNAIRKKDFVRGIALARQ